MTFEPPASSEAVLQNIDFGKATPVAANLKAAFDADDQRPENRDQSRCKALLNFGTQAVFWSSKMAIDADGPAAGPDHRSGSQMDPENGEGQNDTAYHFPNGGTALSSEAVPYVVMPGGTFAHETGLRLGDFVLVVFGDKKAGAVLGDTGPAHKIGEGSIRLHELLHPPAPDPCASRDEDGRCVRIRDASVEQNVLFFAFPDSAMTEGIGQSNAEGLAQEKAEALFESLQTL